MLCFWYEYVLMIPFEIFFYHWKSMSNGNNVNNFFQRVLCPNAKENGYFGFNDFFFWCDLIQIIIRHPKSTSIPIPQLYQYRLKSSQDAKFGAPSSRSPGCYIGPPSSRAASEPHLGPVLYITGMLPGKRWRVHHPIFRHALLLRRLLQHDSHGLLSRFLVLLHGGASPDASDHRKTVNW